MSYSRSITLSAVMTLSLSLSCMAQAATFVVTNTSDAGAGSLRQAIVDANVTAGTDQINFSIPGLGPHTIQPIAALPDITDPVDVNGYSEPGASSATAAIGADLRIKLDGSLAGVFTTGLTISANDTRVRGLLIKNFGGNGIAIVGDNNLVRGCYIGTNRLGTQVRPNGAAGITLSGNSNKIGGPDSAHQNLVSGNQTSGIFLFGDGNTVQGNIIGLDISTTVDLGNAENGVYVSGDNNLIGGVSVGEGNVVSGNRTGVTVAQGAENQLQGNIIGTDSSGTGSGFIGNISGVVLGGFDGNVVGGTEPGAGNLISNNIGTGIEIYNNNNQILGNLIGTEISGSSSLANGSAGILVTGDLNIIGGAVEAARNIVSGNDSAGILIQPALLSDIKPRFNRVLGNYIGTDISGSTDIPNGLNGIFMTDTDANTIGGLQAGAGNLISGNIDDGVHIRTFTDGLNSNANVVIGNIIGADVSRSFALGNTGSGIRIEGADLSRIGSTLPGAENTILWNGLDGITIADGESNAILGNTISDNAALGIDLGANGVSSNDLFDFDVGANAQQNFVRISTATNGVGLITIETDLHSTPSTDFRIEFFSTANCDASNHGEGETYIGSAVVTTGPLGNAPGTHVFSVLVATGHFITATVTAIAGLLLTNTSEFSECIEVF